MEHKSMSPCLCWKNIGSFVSVLGTAVIVIQHLQLPSSEFPARRHFKRFQKLEKMWQISCEFPMKPYEIRMKSCLSAMESPRHEIILFAFSKREIEKENFLPIWDPCIPFPDQEESKQHAWLTDSLGAKLRDAANASPKKEVTRIALFTALSTALFIAFFGTL